MRGEIMMMGVAKMGGDDENNTILCISTQKQKKNCAKRYSKKKN
jgi:hypothetical protein